jgi:pimeloyl-ACP methyl ester carboxylesterase
MPLRHPSATAVTATDMEDVHRGRYLPGEMPIFYDELGPAGAGHSTIVLVHGGVFSGSCYLTTPDGRPGWAYDFVRHGYRVVVPDWPGVGRSSSVPPDEVDGRAVARALGALLEHLGQRTVLLVHSMSGPYGFRLLETHGHLIRALIAVAPGPPGNIQPVSEAVRMTETEIEMAKPYGNVVIPRTGVWRPTREFAIRKLIGASTRFDPDHLPGLLAQTVPIPVQLLMGRANLRGAQLVVERRDRFEDKPVLVLTGENDTDHPREADLATVKWLRGLGADVDYNFLSEHGVHGNGHMLMSEDNSSEIADIAATWLTGQLADS